MNYNFNAIEAKWQTYWKKHQTFQAKNPGASDKALKPSYYVLDMFPYPSGAGLHVGHPLGYIASDILTRYKRHQGFNVLHPMGYDSFGLPAEQYAIQTGQHPAVTTEANIKRYREQLDKIGFSFDWSREVRTSDPRYYQWTQWIFLQLFKSWYDNKQDKARPVSELIRIFSENGNFEINAACDEDTELFSAEEWNAFSGETQQETLLKYRLTYLAETEVNWCPALGTVLANDEIINGVSERGGHPVVRKKMKQWIMRITAYAERLLRGLETIDWTDSLKERQRNWIGKSKGAQITFKVRPIGEDLGGDEHQKSSPQPQHETHGNPTIKAFTTRPDTIFGVTYITLAPEHELVQEITTDAQRVAVENYVKESAKRSERERQAEVKDISGVFTGAYAEHPFTKKPVPIWIGDYVLAGYGTGAVMAVPIGDERDYRFAKYFQGQPGMPAIQDIFDFKARSGPEEGFFMGKEGYVYKNSDFLNGLSYREGLKKSIQKLEEIDQGKGNINYRLRDAVFSRQRYWGEPFPIYYKNGMPRPIPEENLPLELPEVEKYLPTQEGDPPLARAKAWHWDEKNKKVVSVKDEIHPPEGVYKLELHTMPGWAGSSWYFFRYMEKAKRDKAFASEQALDYWTNVDLYLGGNEHATGHLLYSRFWVKFLKDRGWGPVEEPFQKLINQGMILGESALVHRIEGEDKFISADKINGESTQPIHANVDFVNTSNELDIEAFKAWRPEFKDVEFVTGASGEFTVTREVEKMSKSKYNVVNPDDICEKYGADTLRLYEMFLGPLDQEKPWKTAGLSGVHNFLKKLWNLYHTKANGKTIVQVSEGPASDKALKTLHKTIKKVTEDVENFSFNTSVSEFMICVNALAKLKCNQREVLEPLSILISPFAPHIAEELWERLGHPNSIATVPFPEYQEKYTRESAKTYPISFNGKKRFTMDIALDLTKKDIEKLVMKDNRTKNQLDGKTPKKLIIIPGKIVNIVV